MTSVATPLTMSAPRPWAIAERVLRLPLLGKLAGANALIVISAWGATLLDHRVRGDDVRQLIVLGAALFTASLVNVALVVIALRPIRMLEATAERFWKGDLTARVPKSLVADRGIGRLSEALNLLLESIEADRTRAVALTERIIRHDDEERVDVARELQESHAQALAGLLYHVTAALAECESPAGRLYLEAARDIAQQGVKQLRELSGRVHPQLLNDFGLIAALRHMARTMETGSVSIRVHDAGVSSMRDVPASHKAILYRVTEEAVRNALSHAKATRIEIRISASPEAVGIAIDDDGVGFDPNGSSHLAGLRMMRERLAFIGGDCSVRSAPGLGTVVSLRLPIASAIMEAKPAATNRVHEHSVA